MSAEHANFDRLVVGHVLGDLPSEDAALFRSHLLGCKDCRSRVAELRGIAADLADAERDELARAQLRTQTPRRVEHEAYPAGPAGHRITVRHVTVAAVVVVLLAVAMGFWNLHLRSTSAAYLAVAEDRGATLYGLTTGVPLSPDLAPGITGMATTDGEQVAVSLAGIESLDEDELIVAWFLNGELGVSPVPLARSSQLADGLLAVTLVDPGADSFVISRETSLASAPSGPQLLRVSLPTTGR